MKRQNCPSYGVVPALLPLRRRHVHAVEKETTASFSLRLFISSSSFSFFGPRGRDLFDLAYENFTTRYQLSHRRRYAYPTTTLHV